MRPTFEEACSQFIHRYTMEHIPEWAKHPADNGKFYAPQFNSDIEWYENTKFYGEDPICGRNECYSTNQTWPLGKWLE